MRLSSILCEYLVDDWGFGIVTECKRQVYSTKTLYRKIYYNLNCKYILFS